MTMALGPQRFADRPWLAATLALLAACPPSPARADRCEDTRQAIDEPDRRHQGQHQRRQHHLFDASGGEGAVARLPRQATIPIELYAKADRKPKPEFFDLVAAAGAIIFTIPKADTQTGTSRCIKRMGILRGDKVSMRFRRLNMECTRTKTEASIVVTRGKDE